MRAKKLSNLIILLFTPAFASAATRLVALQLLGHGLRFALKAKPPKPSRKIVAGSGTV